jgi:hypothetical protein
LVRMRAPQGMPGTRSLYCRGESNKCQDDQQ